MPTLTGTIVDVTGNSIPLSEIKRITVKALAERRSLHSSNGIVTTREVPVEVSGLITASLEPGPALLVILGSSTWTYKLSVTYDMTTFSQAIAEATSGGAAETPEMSQLLGLVQAAEDAAGRAETAANEFGLTATASTGAAGSNAAVAVTGDGPTYALGFTIPRGDRGLQGERGPQGIQGLKGDKGDKGDIGLFGPKGDTGDTGPKGDTGERGPQGLQGDTGPKGDTGLKGDEGDPGPKGDKGDKGDPGETGPKGDPGDEGPEGPQGPPGVDGSSSTWAEISGKPTTFPPATHGHTTDGIEHVVEGNGLPLNVLFDAVLGAVESIPEEIFDSGEWVKTVDLSTQGGSGSVEFAIRRVGKLVTLTVMGSELSAPTPVMATVNLVQGFEAAQSMFAIPITGLDDESAWVPIVAMVGFPTAAVMVNGELSALGGSISYSTTDPQPDPATLVNQGFTLRA